VSASVASLSGLLAPREAALLVIDMQNDYCASNGHLARHGRDISAIATIIPRIAGAIASAREAGVLVIYTRQTTLPHGASVSPARRRYKELAKPGLGSDYPLAYTWGYEIVGDLAPESSDIVIDKFRSSAFFQTPLDLILRANARKTTLICGAVTEGCVESTVRDAAHYDYLPVILSDAVASTDTTLHAAAMTVMRGRYDCVACADVVAAWTEHEATGMYSTPPTR
jgi:nicotinamidase-related amidase